MKTFKPFDYQDNYTQFHNLTLEGMMPVLSGSAWKVLCCIIRRTKGYQVKSSQITQRQIMKDTGIKSFETIGRATADLECCEFINIIRSEDKQEAFAYELNLALKIEAATISEAATALKNRARSALKNRAHIKKGSKESNKESICDQASSLHKHPAVVAHKDIFQKSMRREQYPHVQHITDIDKWTNVLKEWLLRGYSPYNLSGMLSWYRGGIPERYQKKQKVDTSRTDAWTVLPPLPPEEAARQKALLMADAERVFG